MNEAKAKIWAKKFYRGERTVDDFNALPAADQAMVKAAYERIYGEPMPV